MALFITACKPTSTIEPGISNELLLKRVVKPDSTSDSTLSEEQTTEKDPIADVPLAADIKLKEVTTENGVITFKIPEGRCA